MAYGKISLGIIAAAAVLSSCSEKMSPASSSGSEAPANYSVSQPTNTNTTQPDTRSKLTTRNAGTQGAVSASPAPAKE